MRFCGIVGYATSAEESPGVWKDTITEKTYYGNVVRNSRRLEAPSLVPPETNANLSLENSFSILADDEAYVNWTKMRYVIWEGSYWSIDSVEVQRPRIILTIGGVWNGVKA